MGTMKGEEEDDENYADWSKRKLSKNTREGGGGGKGLVFCNLSFILIVHLKYTPCNHIYRWIEKWNFDSSQKLNIFVFIEVSCNYKVGQLNPVISQ